MHALMGALESSCCLSEIKYEPQLLIWPNQGDTQPLIEYGVDWDIFCTVNVFNT